MDDELALLESFGAEVADGFRSERLRFRPVENTPDDRFHRQAADFTGGSRLRVDRPFVAGAQRIVLLLQKKRRHGIGVLYQRFIKLGQELRVMGLAHGKNQRSHGAQFFPGITRTPEPIQPSLTHTLLKRLVEGHPLEKFIKLRDDVGNREPVPQHLLKHPVCVLEGAPAGLQVRRPYSGAQRDRLEQSNDVLSGQCG
jgi:hypothetical protein